MTHMNAKNYEREMPTVFPCYSQQTSVIHEADHAEVFFELAVFDLYSFCKQISTNKSNDYQLLPFNHLVGKRDQILKCGLVFQVIVFS